MSEKQPISVKELEQMLEENSKLLAKIDKEYVGYEEKGHLFEYNINFETFLNDIAHVIKSYKARHQR